MVVPKRKNYNKPVLGQEYVNAREIMADQGQDVIATNGGSKAVKSSNEYRLQSQEVRFEAEND